MPTPAERKALLFFAAVAVLGAGVRGARALGGGAEPDVGARRALAAQLARVDSARAAPPRPKRGARRKAGRSDRPSAERATVSEGETPRDPPRPQGQLDLDVATPAEIERLPGVGAVLAERIAASRAKCGPFGSLRALERVRGVGPKLAERLAPHVTFSSARRPLSEGPGPCAEAASGGRRRPESRVPAGARMGRAAP